MSQSRNKIEKYIWKITKIIYIKTNTNKAWEIQRLKFYRRKLNAITFTIAIKWNQFKYPLTGEYIHTCN